MLIHKDWSTPFLVHCVLSCPHFLPLFRIQIPSECRDRQEHSLIHKASPHTSKLHYILHMNHYAGSGMNRNHRSTYVCRMHGTSPILILLAYTGASFSACKHARIWFMRAFRMNPLLMQPQPAEWFLPAQQPVCMCSSNMTSTKHKENTSATDFADNESVSCQLTSTLQPSSLALLNKTSARWLSAAFAVPENKGSSMTSFSRMHRWPYQRMLLLR